MRNRLNERERDLFAALEGFDPEGTVVIGGYGVSARAVPRFSHDLDLVVDPSHAERVATFLTTKRFRLTARRAALEQNYGGSWERWQRASDGPTVDVLTASVQDRSFRIPYPYERVAHRAELMALRGASVSAWRAWVAAPEVLIALKVQPMRRKDIGDIACLATAGYEPAELRRLTRPLTDRRPALLARRLDLLESELGPDDASAQRFLGTRIAGIPAIRVPYIRAARALVRTVRGWLPPK